MAKIRVLELFAGIGALSKALTNLGVEHEIFDAVEIDKYAIKSFNAIHSTNFEPQDITKWNKDIECDLIMHGSPCQDFSVAGKGAGGDKDSGTRSSLMYETLRIVEKLKPKYVIWENVKNLLSKKHRHNFDAYLEAMEELGYKSYYQVLNAKDYGTPQNRERVFTISILGGGNFTFPPKIPLTKRLKDVLETEVDEKYYLSDKQMEKLNASNYDQNKRIYDVKGVSPTLSTMGGGNRQPKIVASRGRGMNNEQHLEPRKDGLTNTITSVQKDNYVAEPRIIEDFYKSRPTREYSKVAPTLRSERSGLKVAEPKIIDPQGRKNKKCVPKDYAPTLRAQTHGNPPQVLNGFRIRKLTPKECWRLMGFDDEDFEKAAKANSSTQLYKQAGNSIVVDVLEAILKELLHGK